MGGGISICYEENRKPWKQLINSEDARKQYVSEGTIRDNCTVDELVCRVLLDDPVGFSALDKFASLHNDRSLLSQWKKLLRRHQGTGVDDVCIPSLFLENKVDVQDDLAFCFDQIYTEIFADFKNSEAYQLMCNELQQTNKVQPSDFDYFTKLGSGSFGCVFSCRKRSTGALYAMKVQPKAVLLHQLRQKPADVMVEMLASTGCPSPFMCQATYAFQTPKLVFLALPLYHNGDLRRALKMEPAGHFSFERSQFYAAELASVLMFLHRNGLMHRDLKPENVFIDDLGHLVLGDLGSICDEQGRLQPKVIGPNSPELVSADGDSWLGFPNVTASTARKDMTDSVSVNTRQTKNIPGVLKGELSRNSGLFHAVNALTGAVSECDVTKLGGNKSIGGDNFSAYSVHSSAGEGGESIGCSYSFESRAEGVVGTMRYMAPEVMALFADKQGRNHVAGCTPAVDWFSYGVMVHEMLTGKCPFIPSRSMTYGKLSKVYPAFLALANFDVASVHQTVLGPFITSEQTDALLGPHGMSFVTGLVERDVRKRTGLNKNGFGDSQNMDVYSELKSAPFFEGIHWEDVFARRMIPPGPPISPIFLSVDRIHTLNGMLDKMNKVQWEDHYQPAVKGEGGNSCSLATDRFAVSESDQEYFRDWHYVHPAAVAAEI